MSELQAIMARRRKLADGESAPPPDDNDEQQPSRAAPRRTGSVRNKTRLFDTGGPPKPMQADLQAIMERRRRMEESMEQETTIEAEDPPEPTADEKVAETTVVSGSSPFFPSTYPKKQGSGEAVNVKNFFQQLQQEETNDTTSETMEAPLSPPTAQVAVPPSPPVASPPETVPKPPKQVASQRWSRPAESELTAATKKWNPDGRRVSDRWNETATPNNTRRDAENTTPKRRVSDRWMAQNKSETTEQSSVRQVQDALQQQQQQQPKSPSFLQLQSTFQTSRKNDMWRRKSEASSMIAPPIQDAEQPAHNEPNNSQPDTTNPDSTGHDAILQSAIETKSKAEMPVEDVSKPSLKQLWRRKQGSVEPVLSPKQDTSWRKRDESVAGKDEERTSSTSGSSDLVLSPKRDDSWQRKQESGTVLPSANPPESSSEPVLSPKNDDLRSRKQQQSSASRIASATRSGPVLSPRNDDSWRKRSESAKSVEPIVTKERPLSPADRPLEDTSEPVLSPFQKIRQSFQPAPPMAAKAEPVKPKQEIKSPLDKSERLVTNEPVEMQTGEGSSVEEPERDPVVDDTHVFDAFFPAEDGPEEAETTNEETTPPFPLASDSKLPGNAVAPVDLEKQFAADVESRQDSSRHITTSSEELEDNAPSSHPLTSELSEPMPGGDRQLGESMEPLAVASEDFTGSLNFFENGSLPSVTLTRSSSEPTEEALQTPSSQQENIEITQYPLENDVESPQLGNTGVLETKYLGRRKKASPRRRRSSRLVDIVDTDAPLPSTRSMPDSGEDEKLPETTRRKSPRKSGSRKHADTSPLDCLSSSDEPGFFSSGTDESADRGLPKRNRQISRKRSSPSPKGQNNDGSTMRKRRTRSVDVNDGVRSFHDTTLQSGVLHGSVDSSDCGDTTVTKPSASESSTEILPQSGGDSSGSTVVSRTPAQRNEVVDTDRISVHGDDVAHDELSAQSRDPVEDHSISARDFFRGLAGHEETADETEEEDVTKNAEVSNGADDASVRQVSVAESSAALSAGDQTSPVTSKDDASAENVHFVHDKEASQASAPHESRKPLHESFASFGNFSNINFPIFEGPVVQADEVTETEDTMRGSVGSFDDTFSRATEFPALPTTHIESAPTFESFDDCFADFDGDSFVNINKSAESFAPPHSGDTDFPNPAFSSNDWDTSPIDQIPTLPRRETQMTHDVLLSSRFLTAPTSNPSNSHIIFATLVDAEVVLQEVDSQRNGAVLISQPLLSSALSRRVKAQYRATAHAIKTVWSLASGIDGRTSQVVVIVDLLVLETSVPIRLLLVYEWADTAQDVKLSSVLSPPGKRRHQCRHCSNSLDQFLGGVDFVYDSLSLAVADGLLFLAGSSSRGSCIFVSNCGAEQPWNANYLETDSNITAMETTNRQMNSLPLLVIALDDLSVVVWRYVVCDDSSRCLFPYCCLEYLSLVRSVTSLSLPGEDDSAGAGTLKIYRFAMTYLLFFGISRRWLRLLSRHVVFGSGYCIIPFARAWTELRTRFSSVCSSAPDEPVPWWSC